MSRRETIGWVVFFLFAIAVAFATPAHSQAIDSAIHVNQFTSAGNTVGAMVGAAQQSCPAAPVPCILVIDPSLAAWATGTMPTLCGNCHVYDWRNGPPPPASPLTSDIILNATRHFDVRSVGAICNGIADDTAAFVSALARANQSLIELPQQTCKINPGPSSGASALIIPQAQQDFRIVGFQGQWGSVIASNTSNTSDAPLITVGDTRLTSTQWVEGADFQEFQLRGGNQDCYPNGVLHYTNNQNLSTSYNLGIRTWGTAYSTPCTFIGLMNDGPNWQEMKYYDLGIFGPSSSSWLTPSVSSTGMIISADQGNTDLFAPNIENFQTGINFRGAGGSPIVTISGGHFERVGLCWLDADQAQVFAYGVDVAAGMTCLGQGVFGSHIEMDAASVGWNAPVIDNGLGNSITQAAGSPGVAGATNTDGTEWYRVANAVPDPTFTAGTAGWTCTNANISVSEQKSPGAKVGQSIQVAPTSAGGYCTKSFVLPSSGDYLVGGSFFFDIYATAAQLQIYDQTCSVLLWDSGVFGASVATPGATYGTNAGDRAWRFIKTRVPSGSATSFCVRVIAPTASVPAIIAGLFIVPSAQTMTGASITGTGSCSGTGSAYACSTPGENRGAASNNISWTVSPQPYGSFLRLVCTAASDAGQPTIMYGYANGANVARLQPGATREITLPLGFFAGFVELYDYTGPTTDPNDISCTQLTVNPIYQELTIGIANPSDSNFVQYVDQAGVQHRGAPTVAGVPQVLCSITAPLTNTGSTSQTQLNSCAIPAGTIGVTGRLVLTAAGSACSASTAPYSGCTAANAGTCEVQIYIASTNTGTNYGLVGSVAQTAAKNWSAQSVVKAQNSTTSEAVSGIITYGGTPDPLALQMDAFNTANTQYLNTFMTNSVSGNVCGVDTLALVYWPN